MAITQFKMTPDNPASWRMAALAVSAVAISQADVNVQTALIPFRFEVVAVAAWAQSLTATLTVDVKLGTTSCLAAIITPTQTVAAPAIGTLATTRANRRGNANTTVRLHVTTNGTGVATNLLVTVSIRPYPLNGEA